MGTGAITSLMLGYHPPPPLKICYTTTLGTSFNFSKFVDKFSVFPVWKNEHPNFMCRGYPIDIYIVWSTLTMIILHTHTRSAVTDVVQIK